MQTTPQNIKAKKSAHTLKINDVLYSSWGYEQTNVDFFQVVRTTAQSVWVKELKQQKVATADMSGTTTPLINEFKENAKERMHRVKHGDSIRIESYTSASLWDGKPVCYSSYA
ncbi:MAG: hypothetical protein V4525_17090 [Pseudomonadota bacterium]